MRFLLACFIGFALLAGCDHGLAPPPVPPLGTLRATITYENDWPPPDSLFDLRFVAFRFVPQDSSDFFRLNELLISPSLPQNVAEDLLVLDSVQTGTFVYSGIAQRFGASITDWRPVGLYEANGGVFTIDPGETTGVSIRVDFENLPPFPPAPL